MSSESRDLQDLPSEKLRWILEKLGGTAIIYTSKENKPVARTQQGSMRTRIMEKISELQGLHGGAILTPKGGMVDGPAKDEYTRWYLNERAGDIAANPEKDYHKWAFVHLADSIKHRKESVREVEPVAS